MRSAALALALGGGCATPALASADYGGGPRLTLVHPERDSDSNVAFLSPGNDTRTNLLLLRGGRLSAGRPPAMPYQDPGFPALFDWSSLTELLVGAPDVGTRRFGSGEGSRCRSDEGGTAAFVAAVRADGRVSPADRAGLVDARTSLRPTCAGGETAPVPPLVVAGDRAGEFRRYLTGAAAFYAGDFDRAAADFAALGRSANPWLAETALYMRARVEVNRAQVGLFDEWGFRPDGSDADPAIVAAAEAGLSRYLTAHPTGRYAASARGLFRRVHWLAGDDVKLARALAAALATAPAGDAELANEIDDKLLAHVGRERLSDPVLLAAADLRDMRVARPDARFAAPDEPLTAAQLAGQRARFAADPALFELLRANQAFYIAGRPADVLRLIPDAARQRSFDDREFSRQMLRGLALEATGDAATRAFWLRMLDGAAPGLQRRTLELAIAFHDERHDGLDRVFAPGSPVTDPALRERLLTRVAGPALLRRRAAAGGREGRIALWTLLHKGLTRGRYSEFVTDLERVTPALLGPVDDDGVEDLATFARARTEEEFACPALAATARALAADPLAVRPRLCLGEFLRLANLDEYDRYNEVPADELGGTPSRFGGATFTRGDAYRSILRGRAGREETAYALYRAVECYGPSAINSCGGADVPVAQRRRWFERLHGEFADTRWAQASRFYW